MVGVGEHVEGIADFGFVPEAGEDPDVPRLRHGIAGDIDDAARAELCERFKKARGASRARRVDEG